tara:strand:- start:207 stop:578 length:372 start_codon:yes stop_codon:yes gene_type:complete
MIKIITRHDEVVNQIFTFNNKWTVSVSIGRGSYSHPKGHQGLNPERSSVEVAVFDNNDNFETCWVYENLFNRDIGDDIVGGVTSNELAKVMNFVADMPIIDLEKGMPIIERASQHDKNTKTNS